MKKRTIITTLLLSASLSACIASTEEVENGESAVTQVEQAATSAKSEIEFGPNTAYRWLTYVSSSTLKSHIDDGYRIVDLEVVDTGPRRYDAILVRNTGSYSKTWWWWTSLTAQQIGEKLEQKNARLIQLKPYIQTDGDLRYAVVMVKNTGSDQRNWSWFPNASFSDIAAHRNATGDRIIDIESYELNGSRRYSAIADADDTGGYTALLQHSNANGIMAWLENNPEYRLVDWEHRARGGYAAIAARDPERPYHWNYFGVTQDQVTHLLGRHHARLIDIESYVSGGQRRYDVLLRDNGIVTEGAGTSLFGGAQTYDDAIEQFMRDYQMPAMGLALVQDGRLIYTKGYGWADIVQGEQATPERMFRIGSNSKVFAAAAMMQLIERGTPLPAGSGNVRLDTRIFRDILRPAIESRLGSDVDVDRIGYDSWYDQITVADVLYHRSGLTDEGTVNPITNTAEIARDLGIRDTPTCPETVFWMFDKSNRLTPNPRPVPGTVDEYYNTGPCIISAAVEVLVGRSFENYLWTDLLNPQTRSRIMNSSDIYWSFSPETAHYSLLGDFLSGAEMVVPRRVDWADDWTSDGWPIFSNDNRVPFPYGGIPLINGTAPGGLAASPVAWAHFLTTLDGSASAPILSATSWAAMTTDGGAGSAERGMFLGLNSSNGDVFHNGSVGGGFGWFVFKNNGALWVVAGNSSAPAGAVNDLNSLMIDAYNATQADFAASTWDLFPQFGLN